MKWVINEWDLYKIVTDVKCLNSRFSISGLLTYTRIYWVICHCVCRQTQSIRSLASKRLFRPSGRFSQTFSRNGLAPSAQQQLKSCTLLLLLRPGFTFFGTGIGQQWSFEMAPRCRWQFSFNVRFDCDAFLALKTYKLFLSPTSEQGYQGNLFSYKLALPDQHIKIQRPAFLCHERKSFSQNIVPLTFVSVTPALEFGLQIQGEARNIKRRKTSFFRHHEHH